MYYQPEQILEQYDIEFTGIVKSRDGYVCETPAGKYLLMPFLGSMNRAMQIKAFTDYLQIEELLLNKEGNPLADMGNEEVYCLKRYVSGRECNPLNIEDGVAGMETLAHFHNKMERYRGDFSEQQFTMPLELRLEKREKELIHNKNYARSRRKKTTFEDMFLKQYAEYREEIRVTRNALLQLSQVLPVCLCHGDVNHHNLVHTSGGMLLTHFEHMQWDYPITDVAMLYRKILEKTNWEPNVGMQLLNAYCRVRPMTQEEKEAFGIWMHVPERFCKISSHYFHTAKTWASNRDVEKLYGLKEQEKRRKVFLEKLFPFS